MRYLFNWKGEEVQVEYQKIGTQLWFTYQGQTFVRPLRPQSSRGRAHSEQEASGLILSPMPGKVTKILKSPGASVEKGESIIVMEAMKMEYTLKAEVPGEIESLNCTVGEQVALGKLLVKIK